MTAIQKCMTPPFLKHGDRVGIAAPARKISKMELETAIRILENKGMEVVLGEHLFYSSNQYAGSDEQRTLDFQRMLDDEKIKAIFCARGGYGSVRIIDKLNFEKFRKKPKWLIGFSDITVFHSHIHNCFAIETLHAPMPVNFSNDNLSSEALDMLFQALFGKTPHYSFEAHPLNRNGFASGVLVGGNLSVLYSLTASQSDIKTDNKILFIEDLDEYLYHIDRMMQCLKRAGKLENLAALMIGGMTKMNDNAVPFGKSALEIIAETVKDYQYPLCFNVSAGHIKENFPLVLGREVALKVNPNIPSTLCF